MALSLRIEADLLALSLSVEADLLALFQWIKVTFPLGHWQSPLGASLTNLFPNASLFPYYFFASVKYTSNVNYNYIVSVLGIRDEGYTVKYNPSPEGVPEGEA